MKILYLITKSNWGGAQKYVYDLATAFSARKCDVAVAFGGHGELAEKLGAAGIRAIPLDSLVRDINVAKEIKSTLALYSLLKKEKPDVLHVNSSKAGGLGAFLGRLVGIKCIVFTVHGAPFREDRSALVRALMYFFTWITCLLSHKVIAVSKRDAHDIGQMFFVKKKVTTIYNGIVFNEIVRMPSSQSKEVHIVTIGDLTKNKGYLYGLEAIAELVIDRGYSIRYFIEGEGEDRQEIESFIAKHKLQNHVTLLGRTLKTGDRLHEFDIFMLPSVKEGLPYVLLEAGRAMMPVISTITGGIPEIVRHEGTGLLVKPKDSHQLAREIERLILDKKFAKKLGIELHSHVVQNFSHAKMLAETARAYGLIKPSN
jgi:glycosyltransferase involved in cell wall biosynthesis